MEFTLTKEQVEMFKKWEASKTDEELYAGFGGGAFEFTFTPH